MVSLRRNGSIVYARSGSATYEPAELSEGRQEYAPRRWPVLIARVLIVCLRLMHGFPKYRLAGVIV